MKTEEKDNVNKGFVSAGDRADGIFDYLNEVRQADRDQEDYSPEELSKLKNKKDPLEDNTYSKNFVTRIPVIKSRARAFNPPEGQSVNYTGYIMPGNRPNKKIASAGQGILERLGNTKLSDIDDAIGKYTVNPVVQSLLVGGAAGLGMYAFAPTITKYLSMAAGDKPRVNSRTGEIEWISPEERKNTALWAGIGLGLGNLARHINYKNPSISNITSFPKKASSLKKLASMLGPVDYVPKSFAANAVYNNPSIPDPLKFSTLGAINSISGSGDRMINSTDMVTAGINSGFSGRTGLPVGRIAAAATSDALAAYGVGSMFGVQSPGNLARNVGLGSAALRGLSLL